MSTTGGNGGPGSERSRGGSGAASTSGLSGLLVQEVSSGLQTQRLRDQHLLAVLASSQDVLAGQLATLTAALTDVCALPVIEMPLSCVAALSRVQAKISALSLKLGVINKRLSRVEAHLDREVARRTTLG
uniref:Uncharacterized protein n=1 Tax=Chlamydomonas euryale TaxID=1486919 RepID=A0A7R9V407_9CHLO|mmetsp:Transcript_17183/g.51614  ORF Transcript_17183/g.51614 Transcript_17183/m.51614 type:complete len:130 (+) Transcript_17183:213-602(+)